MNWKIWLAFGFGLIFGACGMATLLGCLMWRGDELCRKTKPAFDQVLRASGMFACNVRANLPRVVIGYFAETHSEKERKDGIFSRN